MHILFINDQCSFGGVPRVIQSLCYALDDEGIQTSVLTYYESTDVFLKLPSKTQKFSLEATSRFDIKAYLKLKSLLSEIKPDIIHDHFGGLWSFFLHQFKKCPAVMHYHNEFQPVEESPDAKRSLRNSVFINRLLSKYDHIVCVSSHNRKQLLKLNPELEDHSTVIPNFIPDDFFIEKSHHKLIPPYKIGFIGRLVYEKGVDTYLEVMRELNKSTDAEGLIVGSGDANYTKQLKQFVHAHNLPITFIGQVDDVRPYLDKMDLLLFTSRQEPFGLVLLEAMARKVPIVGCYPENGGGPEEILGKDFLCTKRDVSKISASSKKVLTDIESRSTTLNHIKSISKKYHKNHVIHQFIRLYSQLNI